MRAFSILDLYLHFLKIAIDYIFPIILFFILKNILINQRLSIITLIKKIFFLISSN